MKGMIKTGVRVTASYLSEIVVPRMRAYPPLALYIRNRIKTKKDKQYLLLTEHWEFVPFVGVESNEVVADAAEDDW